MNKVVSIQHQGELHEIPLDVINKITSPPTSKEEAQALLGILGFQAYSKFQPDWNPTLFSDPKKEQFQISSATLSNSKVLNRSKEDHAVALGSVGEDKM